MPYPVPAAGANGGWLREPKPRYPQQPRREAWKPANLIPVVDRNELRRRVAEALETQRPQREAMKAAGLAMLGAA